MHRPRVRTALAGALIAGFALTQQGCSPASPTGNAAPSPAGASTPAPSGADPSAAPSPSATGSSDAGGSDAGGGDAVLRGDRQVVIRPIRSFESILAVDADGRLTLTDGDTERALFVLDPVGARHQMKTAKADSSGEPACMGLKDNGARADTVVAAACDTAAEGQLFTLQRGRQKDEEGRPTYAIKGEGGRYLRSLGRDGLVAEAVGDAGPDGAFVLVDNGAAALPKVGD